MWHLGPGDPHGPPTVLECQHTLRDMHLLAESCTWCVCQCKLEEKHAISAVKGDLLPQRSELIVWKSRGHRVAPSGLQNLKISGSTFKPQHIVFQCEVLSKVFVHFFYLMSVYVWANFSWCSCYILTFWLPSAFPSILWWPQQRGCSDTTTWWLQTKWFPLPWLCLICKGYEVRFADVLLWLMSLGSQSKYLPPGEYAKAHRHAHTVKKHSQRLFAEAYAWSFQAN